ncbi:MAG: hypothetical protein JW723_01420 [Bacteroidales bacterium]|nr:hypothetical protein [Bacteroidales bacterium]
MRTLQLRLLISWLLLLVNNTFFGQDKPQITDLRLSFENNQLEIRYNLIGGYSTDTFRLWVEITDSAGSQINAESLTGDLGYPVSGGIDKKILWNLSEDGLSINKEIFIEVKAEKLAGTESGKRKPFRKESGYGELFIKSAALPGWGLTEIKRGKPFWIVGVSGYACLVTSYIYNQKAMDTKSEYENSPYVSIDVNDDIYRKAMNQHKVSRILAYSFVALWITDKIILAVSNKRPSRNPGSANSGLSFAAAYDPYFQNQVFRIFYKF